MESRKVLKQVSVYTNGSLINVGEKEHDMYVPCLLTVEALPVPGGLELSIRGRVNPLPFKKAVITRPCTSIRAWLEDNGWEEIKRDYVPV